MAKKFLLVLFASLIIFSASSVFASDIEDVEKNVDNLEQYLTIKRNESVKILQKLPKIFIEEWKNNIDDGNWTKDIDPLLLAKTFTNKYMVKFLAVDYPLDVAFSVGEEVIDLSRMIGAGDFSTLIGKVEKITVNKAVKYTTGELFKHEIRVGSGAMVSNYISKTGETVGGQLNYIIAKKEISENKYKIAIKFYSPKAMKVPKNRMSTSGSIGGVYESKKEIKPFTITIKGEMKYNNFSYSWIDSPEIDIEYPEKVPDFKFKPTSFWEERFVKPIKSANNWFKKIIGRLGGSVFDSFNSKNLEVIESNEELKDVAEKIEKVEKEIEKEVEEIKEDEGIDQKDKDFAKKVSQLNIKNKEFKEKKKEKPKQEIKEEPKNEEIVLKENMTEEETKRLLIAIYKELLKRKITLADFKEKKKEEVKKEKPKQEKEETKTEKKEEVKKEKPKQENKKEQKPSYCVFNNQTSLKNKLIINEIAWMGTNDSSSDEWIELKNISTEAINLKNYQLLDKDNQIKIIFDNLTINPNEYLLLERTDDNSVPNVLADLIYKGGLSNKKEALYLFNDNCELLDEALAVSDWEYGDNTNKKSMERRPDLTWQTYSGNSFGTPKAKNSEGQKEFISLPSGGGGGSSNSDSGQEIIKPSYCLQTNLKEPLKTPLIINEIAWMGTGNSATNEWIELKNISDKEVSLKDWQLLDKDNQIKIIFDENDILPAQGFYLLERTDDEAVSEVRADKIYTGALADKEESLRLFNSDCELVDEALAVPDWEYGDKINKKSMERKPDLTWQTYSGQEHSTPKAENSNLTLLVSKAEQYCLDQGYTYKSIEDVTYCIFDENNKCEITHFYSGECGSVYYHGIPLDHLIIAEVEDGYKNDGREYVRIFNQTGSDVPLCSDQSCIYLTYFTMEGATLPTWNTPKFSIPLPKVTLKNNSYFQIDISKDNRGDFKVFENEDDCISSNYGSMGLFSKDVGLLSEEDAKKAKIDLVGWTYSNKNASFNKNSIIEKWHILKSSWSDNDDNRVFMVSRIKDSSNGLYLDRNNNALDFEYKKSPIYTVPSILNFKLEEPEDKEKLKLSWNYASDLDISKLSYKIYYSENSLIDNDNLTEIIPETSSVSEKHVEAIISPIKEGVDYRFKVKLFEEGGNESEFSETLFYVYISSFSDHILDRIGYDINRSNKVNVLGPQNSNIAERKITDSIFLKPPVIDKYGNFYFIRTHHPDPFNYIESYDKNGLLRWRTKIKYGNTGELFLTDAIYYYSNSQLFKFSYRGEELWKTFVNNDYAHWKTLFYNKGIYFHCLLGDKRGVCKRNLEKDGVPEMVYEMKRLDKISNFIKDDKGNIFFVCNSSKLIKIDASNISVEIPIEVGERPVLRLFQDKLFVFSYHKKVLIDKDNMVVINNFERDEDVGVAWVGRDGFYFIENHFRKADLFFLNPSSNEIEEIASDIEVPRRCAFLINNPIFITPVVDLDNNFYYGTCRFNSSNNAIVGYKREGDKVVKFFDYPIDSNSFSKLVFLENKIYYTDKKGLIELSF